MYVHKSVVNIPLRDPTVARKIKKMEGPTLRMYRRLLARLLVSNLSA
jgi:hypothetical protein